MEPIMESPKAFIENVDGVQFAILPPDFSVESLEKFVGAHAPRFPQGEIRIHDINSLTAYLHRYAGDECVIYVDGKNHSITAILDDGDAFVQAGEMTQGRRVHRAGISIGLDPKFKAWQQICANAIGQKAFIKFIEMFDSHFQTPSGADMRTLAASLELKKTTVFKNMEKLGNGAIRDYSLQYETDTHATGEIVLPNEIKILIPIFEHQARAVIPVRLYAELKENAVIFELRIPNEQGMIDEAWEQVKRDLHLSLSSQKLEHLVINAAAPSAPTS